MSNHTTLTWYKISVIIITIKTTCIFITDISFPFFLVQGHFGSSMYQNQIHIPGYCPGYYPHENAFVPPPFSSFFVGTPNHGQDTQQGNVTQSVNTNPYNVFPNFK